jgi:hypothetical protein
MRLWLEEMTFITNFVKNHAQAVKGYCFIEG